MYNFRIKPTFLYVFIADITALLIVLFVMLSCITIRANQFKKTIEADKIDYCYINVTEKYGSRFGAINSIKPGDFGDSAPIVADDTYSYVQYFKADGTDAIDTREKFIGYLEMNRKNADTMDLTFLLTAICFLLQFVCLVVFIFSEKRFYYILISMVPSILLLCFYLSDKFYILYLSIVTYIAMIGLCIYELKRIYRMNNKILHRYDETEEV